MTFKDDLDQICKVVASEFPGWSFKWRNFKNKTLKHTDLLIDSGLIFQGTCYHLHPYAIVDNKKVSKLYKHFRDYAQHTLLIDFQLEDEKYYSDTQVINIFPNPPYTQAELDKQSHKSINQSHAKDYFRGVLSDGIGFLDKYFDLTTEENLLRNLPTTYRYRDTGLDGKGGAASFYDGRDGISHCLAALVIGDFDFVEHYACDDFKTLVPKDDITLKKILAELPAMKKRFAETGQVI